MFWALLVFAPIYAGGALFLREAWRRTGGGYLNLLLLGVAYGLVEEGLALQSLTSPHLYGAAGWAPRLLGVNTDYTELNLVYHAVFSVTIPVVLVELLFRAARRAALPAPRRRDRERGARAARRGPDPGGRPALGRSGLHHAAWSPS